MTTLTSRKAAGSLLMPSSLLSFKKYNSDRDLVPKLDQRAL